MAHGRGSRKTLRNGLTPKENALKNKVLEQIATTGDINGTEAALQVYDTTDKATAAAIASEVLKKPQISQSIEEALSAQGGNIDQITQNITNIANHKPEKISAETVLKANIEILRLTGHYVDKKNTKKIVTKKSIVETLSTTEANTEIKKVHTEVTQFMQEAEIA